MKIVYLIIFLSLVVNVLSRRKRFKIVSDNNVKAGTTLWLGVGSQSTKDQSDYEGRTLQSPRRTLKMPNFIEDDEEYISSVASVKKVMNQNKIERNKSLEISRKYPRKIQKIQK